MIQNDFQYFPERQYYFYKNTEIFDDKFFYIWMSIIRNKQFISLFNKILTCLIFENIDIFQCNDLVYLMFEGRFYSSEYYVLLKLSDICLLIILSKLEI
jgi:hypothetical protein